MSVFSHLLPADDEFEQIFSLNFVSVDKKNNSPDTASQTVVVDGNVVEILQEGLQRLKDQGTWKVWRWDAKSEPYIDAEAFRREAEVCDGVRKKNTMQ